MKLDERQREVVFSKETNILVVAGAGSGKTKVLTERIKQLILEGVPSSSIVAITFTNLASEEMRFRLQEIPSIGDSFIGTIHSFANKIYKTSGVVYRILNEELEQKAYHEILTDSHMKKKLTFERWLGYKDLMKKVESFRVSESELENYFLPSEKSVLTLAKKLARKIYIRDGIIDFEQLLQYALDYFKSIGASLEHLFVDEVQDIGKLEFEFLKTLNAKNYFLVGDDFQAIYGFKGGDVKIFKNLVENPEFKTYYLLNNYRNCKEIVSIGNKVISQIADEVIPKDSNVISTLKGRVTFQSKHLTGTLMTLLKSKQSNESWFLLTRSNKEIGELASLMIQNRVPFVVIKKGDYSLEELNEVLEGDNIKLLTVHSAKGLECDKAVLYGNFPLFQPSYMSNSDERKVMYVGVTRAKEEVHIFN